MVSLSILTDFCNYWWLWWILPFILGCLLMYSIMKKWRVMYHKLIQENRKQKKKLSKIDGVLLESQKEVKDLKGQLAIQRGKISELEDRIQTGG